MAKRGTRARLTVHGKTYWYNPETGRWFDKEDAKWNEDIDAPVGGWQKVRRLGLGVPEGMGLSTVTIGGKTYTVDPATGVVRDENGVIQADATFNPETGGLAFGGETVDTTPGGTPIAGVRYERDFSGPNWGQVSSGGVTYYYHTGSGNVFTAEGVYVGTYRNGTLNLSEDVPPGGGTDPGTGDPGTGDPEEPGETPEERREREREEEKKRKADADLLSELQTFLDQWGLGALKGFVQNAISQGWSYNRILLEIRQTPEYKAAYPEVEIRQKNGFAFMPEATILNYRDDAKRLANQIWGVNISNQDIASLIGNNISVAEFEHRLNVFKHIERWGPAVKNLFQTQLGINLDDDKLYEFFDPKITSQELDEQYEMARRRGMTATLGLGVRSKEEAELLKQMGVSVEEGFSRYEGVAAQRSMFERFGAIEDRIQGTGNDFLNEVPLNRLIRGVVLRDPEALAEMGQILAREVARFNTQSGAASDQQGTMIGLVSPDERRRTA